MLNVERKAVKKKKIPSIVMIISLLASIMTFILLLPEANSNLCVDIFRLYPNVTTNGNLTGISKIFASGMQVCFSTLTWIILGVVSMITIISLILKSKHKIAGLEEVIYKLEKEKTYIPNTDIYTGIKRKQILKFYHEHSSKIDSIQMFTYTKENKKNKVKISVKAIPELIINEKQIQLNTPDVTFEFFKRWYKNIIKDKDNEKYKVLFNQLINRTDKFEKQSDEMKKDLFAKAVAATSMAYIASDRKHGIYVKELEEINRYSNNGILGSIMINEISDYNEYYIFKNKNNDCKKGRIYISDVVKSDKNHLWVINVNKTVKAKVPELKKLADEFQGLVKYLF